MFGIQLTVNYVHPLPIVPTSAVLWMPWKICWIGPLLGYQRNLREDKVMEEEATEEEVIEEEGIVGGLGPLGVLNVMR